MPTRKNTSRKLPVVEAWPNADSSDTEFAQWAEMHSLEKLMGTAEQVSEEPPARTSPPAGKARQAPLGRSLVALRMSREDLEAARRIAREKDIPYTVLLRMWIREGLKREQQQATG